MRANNGRIGGLKSFKEKSFKSDKEKEYEGGIRHILTNTTKETIIRCWIDFEGNLNKKDIVEIKPEEKNRSFLTRLNYYYAYMKKSDWKDDGNFDEGLYLFGFTETTRKRQIGTAERSMKIVI